MRYFTFRHAIDGHPFDWPRVQRVFPHQIDNGIPEREARSRYPHAMTIYYVEEEGMSMFEPYDTWPPLSQ